MKHINSIFYYSLLTALITVPSSVSAGIRVGNVSRTNAQGYQQVNEMRYQATAPQINATEEVGLPITVANQQLAQQIESGVATDVNTDMLERCSMIYPNGEFMWTRPVMGLKQGLGPMCSAVVEMRAVQAALDGSDLVLARAYLGAGDSIKCNINDFPEGSYIEAAVESVEFPADAEPTVDDVVRALNQEQKQNAALKIAAGTVMFGLMGNMIGKNKPGHDGMLGGGKAKTESTVVGALGGAALMVGNVYGGKVAGDMILSTGVNAAAGAVMGNIVAAGDSVLRIEPCTVNDIDYKCLWGYINQTEAAKEGTEYYVNRQNPSDFKACEKTDKNPNNLCRSANLVKPVLNAAVYKNRKNKSDNSVMTLEDIFRENPGLPEIKENFCLENDVMKSCSSCINCGDVKWIKLESASELKKREPVMVVDVDDKAMGWKQKDWDKFMASNGNKEVVGRRGGMATNLTIAPGGQTNSDAKKFNLRDFKDEFQPMYQDAEDGGAIDLSNKARMKGTLTGAGIGGGMGAFTGYQGAQADIQERWVTAVREYKDSLGKIYCGTGQRFLGQYNDTISIPNMPE